MTIELIGLFWLCSAFLNIPILNWGRNRLSRAFGNEPSSWDASDTVFLVLLLPLGPIGVVIGYFMTDWWCGTFEEKETQPQAPINDSAIYSDSRAQRLALRRAGWSEKEIKDSTGRRALQDGRKGDE